MGLMAKPMLVTFPFVLLLLDYWPLNRIKNFDRKTIYRLVLEKIPFMVLAAVFSVIAFFAQRSGGTLQSFTKIGLKFRVYNALISYLKYIEKMFLPANLAVFYPHPFKSISILYIVFSAAVLLAVTILVIRFAKNHRYLVTGWFWYLGTLVPVIGIIQVGSFAMADRYTYITLTGLFIMIAWLLPDLLAKWPQRKIVLGLSMVIVLTTLGICAGRQAGYWKNSITLFSHTIEATQYNFTAYNNLGAAYSGIGRYAESIDAFKQAIYINPDYAQAFNNLGNSYADLGRYVDAIDAYRQAVKIKPDYTKAYFNLGAAYHSLARYAESIDAFKQAVKIDPDYAEAHQSLVLVYLAIGDKNSALAEYNILKSLNPQSANDLLKQINK
jgi:tetratricopeptide (TPR) repeat protein